MSGLVFIISLSINNMKYLSLIALLLVVMGCNTKSKKNTETTHHCTDPKIVNELFIDSVWAANSVGYDMRTVGDKQFIAYYDRDRMMTVAMRQLGSDQWEKKTLDNQLMWDSHNRVVLGVDKEGYIHVSGNMHVHPLAYFRSTKPYDVSSMTMVNKMIGENEKRVTYPSFYYDKEGELYYSYRCGSCGDGDIIVNHFLPETGEWQRYLEKPLFEGVEEHQDRAAYHKKMKDADGTLHFLWMWRWTPNVETCHNLCYATTTDMKSWKNAAGETVTLPFKPEDMDVSVDAVPSKGGLHNSRFRYIFTKDNKAIIAYTKYDEEGFTQLYVAKFIEGAWKIKQVSDWRFRWKFIDGGAFMTKGGAFHLAGISDDGLLAIDWSTETNKHGRCTIDINTLEHSDKVAKIKKSFPDSIDNPLTDIPDMGVRMETNVGDDGTRYVLKWEAQHGGFRQHAPKDIPAGPLSPLVLLEVK